MSVVEWQGNNIDEIERLGVTVPFYVFNDLLMIISAGRVYQVDVGEHVEQSKFGFLIYYPMSERNLPPNICLG